MKIRSTSHPIPVQRTLTLLVDRPSAPLRAAAERTLGPTATLPPLAVTVARHETVGTPLGDVLDSPWTGVAMALAKLVAAQPGVPPWLRTGVEVGTLMVSVAGTADAIAEELAKPPEQRAYGQLALRTAGTSLGVLGMAGFDGRIGDLSLGAVLTAIDSAGKPHAAIAMAAASDLPDAPLAGLAQALMAAVEAGADPSPAYAGYQLTALSSLPAAPGGASKGL